MHARQQKLKLIVRLCEAQGWRCAYCGVPLWIEKINSEESFQGAKQATYDHLTPRSKGGGKWYGNGVAACAPCNNDRQDADPVDFFERGPKKKGKKFPNLDWVPVDIPEETS